MELIGKKVSVYKNLNRGDWSVKHGSDPVRHAAAICLANVTFRVREGARLKVLAGEHRSVHAFCEGVVAHLPSRGLGVSITYNPRRCGSFTTRDGHMPIEAAEFVAFHDDGNVVAYGITFK